MTPKFFKSNMKQLVCESKALTTLEFSLFASGLALVLGMIVMPMAQNYADSRTNPGIDMTTTASVNPQDTVNRLSKKRVVSVTRSILHGNSSKSCIRYADGSENDNC